MQFIKHCWVRLLSNHNIRYIFTIYSRLDTCLMSILRFSFREKVTLRLFKLHFYGADVVEWSTALDIRLIMFKSRLRKNTNLTAQKSNSITVWFSCQTYIIFNIYLVSQVTLRSSGTDILYGCHLLRCLYNMLYFPVSV